MTPIERTAYPRLNANYTISQQNLHANYTLREVDISHINDLIRIKKQRLHYALQLKTFQILGYFIEPDQIPSSIIIYLQKQLGLHHNFKLHILHGATLYRYRQSIRNFLDISPWGGIHGSKSAKRVAIKSAYRSSQTLNTPADIINVVIQDLRTQNCELPAFSTLHRLVRHVRSRVNRTIFQEVFKRLVHEDKILILEELLHVPDGKINSSYQILKQPPKSPRINDFKELIRHHIWVSNFGEMEPFLKDISKQKRFQFSQEAKSLDISNLMDLSDSRRYTLVACLLDHAQKKTRDNLAVILCKTMGVIHKRARAELSIVREKNTDQTQKLAYFVRNILGVFKDDSGNPTTFIKKVSATIEDKGGIDELTQTCDKVIACNSTHHHPLLWSYFKSRRSVLFDLVETIQFGSSTRNNDLMKALEFLVENRSRRTETIKIEGNLHLGFISGIWQQLIYDGKPEDGILNRRFFEVCVFTYLSYELISGDVFIKGAEEFSDYRDSLLSLEKCRDILRREVQPTEFSSNGDEFVRDLKRELIQKSKEFDEVYPGLSDFSIDKNGIPALKKTITQKPTPETLKFVALIQQHMPERNLLDILCNTHHITEWGLEFGSISGSEPRFKQPIDRYILNTFCYGTSMGPAQTAKHVRTDITPSQISWVNQRHVSVNTLNKAKDRVVNYTQGFPITRAWGDGSRCAADGTLRDIYEDNLVAETHFRYASKGAVVYNHISDTYVALFSTFMRCGLWEAVAILDGLLKNDSQIKPTIVHADTQGQSTVVFALAYLLGIKLMPRIRNWKTLKFFRPDKNTTYKNIDGLFSDVIDWELIKTHWDDLIQVVLSIKHGTISSSLLLRKLGTYSRKNRLYQSFQELGKVIRTLFLLEYLSKPKLREIITATTNKVEAYHSLSEWVSFGSNIIVGSNNPDEMEKAIKHNLLICNCVILQNIIDLTETIHKLQNEGVKITKEDIVRLSPYLTSNIKRFGDYVLDLETKQKGVQQIKEISLFS